MERRRKGPGDTRRRRVLRDETAGATVSATRSRSGGSRLQLYVDGAVEDVQPRITDLIPRRGYAMLVWSLCLFFPLALVQGLYIWRTEQFSDFALDQTRALRMVGSGTLATWLSTVLLLLAAALSVMVFSVRRHKLDDYRGGYRLWLWVAVFCLACSLDVVTALHRPFQTLMTHLTGRALWGDGSIWWIGGYGLVGSGLLMRILLDVRRNRGTVVCMLVTAGLYFCTALFYLRVLTIGPGEVDMMAYVAFLMSSHTMLTISLLSYGRYVCLEAAGQMDAVKQKSRSKKKRSEKKARRGWSDFWKRRSQPGKDNIEPAEDDQTTRKQVAGSVVNDDYEDVEDDELERLTDPRLTKGEQRKLRRKQHRRAA